ncbi:MAG: 2-oxoglutarate dehydrogenase E1 subunit family protein, partial [Acidimicrobiia bacterium]
MTAGGGDASRFDEANLGLVDEIHRQYLEDPSSVSEHWREFFEDGSREQPASVPDARPAPPSPAPPPATPASAPSTPSAPSAPVLEGDEMRPLRGAAARIVENMEASLGVPTATSVREIPAKLLEVNR